MTKPEPEIPAQREDRRRIRTRKALIGAGERLFADRSVDGVTIDDITIAADVAKGSFYNHFSGKEGLADTIVELVQGDCEQEVYAANLACQDPVERVARAVGALVHYSKQHPERYNAMVNLTKRRSKIDAPINRGLRHDIESGMAQQRFHGLSLEAAMMNVFALVSSAIELASHEGADTTSAIHDMALSLLRALGVGDAEARQSAQAVAREFGLRPAGG